MDKEKKFLGVSKTVFTLGIVSLLTDVSSEMLVPVIPQFLKFVVGAPGHIIGLIEGVAESTASLLRVYAGYFADKTGKPKALTVLGYGLSALSKPFLVFATIWPHVLGVRFADRFGKGIRSAPRDVLIADATDEASRGRAFGLHRAMDTLGATIGPLVVLLIAWLMLGKLTAHELGADIRLYKTIFLAAAIPAVLGWIVLTVFVKEKKREQAQKERPTISLKAFDKKYKIFLAIVTLFAIGNSSDAFLVLRATDKSSIGMGMLSFLWVYVSFNALQAAVSYRSGILSDKIGRKPVIVAGWIVFAVCYFMIARITDAGGVWVWYLVYGIYYGMTEGVIKAYAVDLAPPNLRGTAVGAYYTFTGLALLPASLIAGFMWDKIRPSAPFYYGAATAAISAVLMWAFVRK